MLDRFGIAFVFAVLPLACTSEAPTAPTPPPSGPGTAGLMSCPPSIELQSVNASPLPVSWEPPKMDGLTVDKSFCSPISGSTFPVGTSTVTCRPDQTALANSCSFSVVVNPPEISCPPSIAEQSVDWLPMIINWDLPAIPGVAVDQIPCSPASGTAFPVGSFTVTCTADWAALTETAEQAPPDSSCSFSISVNPPDSTLRYTRYMAFGDSITAGAVGRVLRDPRVRSGELTTTARRKPDPSIPGISYLILPMSSYPTQLQNLLIPTYASQTINVSNEGLPGERAQNGVSRLTASLLANQPEVLLLLEGYNDIDLARITRSPGDDTPISVAAIANDLRSMVLIAKGLNVEVLLATLTPVTDAREQVAPGMQEAVSALNAEIRSMSTELGLGGSIDLHAALDGVPGLISADGFHPTVAGYQVIAELFFAEIVSRYDITPKPQTTTTKYLRAPGENKSLLKRISLR